MIGYFLPHEDVQRAYEKPLGENTNFPDKAAMGRVFDALYPGWHEFNHGTVWKPLVMKSEFDGFLGHPLLTTWPRVARQHLFRCHKIDDITRAHFNTAGDGGPIVNGNLLFGEIKLFVDPHASFNEPQRNLLTLLKDAGLPFYLYSGRVLKTGFNAVHDRFEEDTLVDLIPPVDATKLPLEEYLTPKGRRNWKFQLSDVLSLA